MPRFLSDADYVVLIRKTINEVENEYQNNNEADAILLGGTMKLETRSSSLSYARQKKKKNVIEREILEGKKILTFRKIRCG